MTRLSPVKTLAQKKILSPRVSLAKFLNFAARPLGSLAECFVCKQKSKQNQDRKAGWLIIRLPNEFSKKYLGISKNGLGNPKNIVGIPICFWNSNTFLGISNKPMIF